MSPTVANYNFNLLSPFLLFPFSSLSPHNCISKMSLLLTLISINGLLKQFFAISTYAAKKIPPFIAAISNRVLWFVFVPLGTLVSSCSCILEASIMNYWDLWVCRFLIWQCQNSSVVNQVMLNSQTLRPGGVQGQKRLYFHMESFSFVACLQVSWKPFSRLC